MSFKAPEAISEIASSPVKRRNWVLGAGALGAAAVVLKALPGTTVSAPVAAVAAVTQAATDTASGGYRVTAHVQRYYDTART